MALWRLIEPFHCFLLSSSSFQFSAQSTDSTIFLRQTCLSDQPIRSTPDQTNTPYHQIRPPHQTTRSDPPTRPQTTILDYSASNHHSIPNLLKWYRSGAFLMGWIKGVIYSSGWTLQSILSTHFRPKFSGVFFRFNLTVVRLASWVPWAGKGLPFPFS